MGLEGKSLSSVPQAQVTCCSSSDIAGLRDAGFSAVSEQVEPEQKQSPRLATLQ